jgi:pyridoxal phosphate enzyme (YggS family)
MRDELHTETDIPECLRRVQSEIAAAAKVAGREPGAVKLVAVSKTMPASAVEQAINAGQCLFGENRVKEALGKWPGLKARYPGIELHLIGPLQTNKVKDAITLFDVIETLDRPKLARVLSEEMERTGKRPRLFVQVNTGEEPQKAGIAPSETAEFVALCRDTYGLTIDGLMCIPPFDEEPSMHFALLAKLARALGVGQLSMGMSGDFEKAIAFGATYVRVGTAIFGARSPLD